MDRVRLEEELPNLYEASPPFVHSRYDEKILGFFPIYDAYSLRGIEEFFSSKGYENCEYPLYHFRWIIKNAKN